MSQTIRLIFLAGIIMLTFACKSDSTADKVTEAPIDLVGKWTMHAAYKGTTPTKLLDNAYFEFSEGGTLKTNVLGDESPYPYSLNKKKLTVSNAEKNIYLVEQKTADTLIMTTKMRNVRFKFVVAKSEE